MSNPTTPFSWQMPTNTDLVTDLPADFEVFGQAVATSMADLLGGTTGQVLSKTSNTDMDFTWVALDDANAIQNTIVDAKGDLIAATAADTPARLAVGTNGQVLTADSTASTGLKWSTPIAATFNVGRNYVATTQSTTSTSYVDLATVQSVTVTTGTKALVMISALLQNGASGNPQPSMSFSISGATTRGVTAGELINFFNTNSASYNLQIGASGTFLVTGLTAGSNVFTAKFAALTGGTAYIGDRIISVIDMGS
jgi:hypothetical protein